MVGLHSRTVTVSGPETNPVTDRSAARVEGAPTATVSPAVPAPSTCSVRSWQELAGRLKFNSATADKWRRDSRRVAAFAHGQAFGGRQTLERTRAGLQGLEGPIDHHQVAERAAGRFYTFE